MSAPPLDVGAGVLVRVPNWLGDAIAIEPLVAALGEAAARAGAPGALTLCGPGRYLDLLAASAPGARQLALGENLRETVATWRGHGTALLANGSLRSAWVALRAGIRRRVGVRRGPRGLLLTDGYGPALERGGRPPGAGPRRGEGALPRPFARTAAEWAGPLGLVLQRASPRLAPEPRALEAARRRLAAAGLCPGAFVLWNGGGRAGSAKSMPAHLSQWRAAWLRQGYGALLAVAPWETPRLGEFQAAGWPTRATASVELEEWLALCSLAALVVSTDGGPAHGAAAVGARLLVLHGPTDPRFGGWPAHARWVQGQVPCGPCLRERCPLPVERTKECFRALDFAAVVNAGDELLRSPAPNAPPKQP